MINAYSFYEIWIKIKKGINPMLTAGF